MKTPKCPRTITGKHIWNKDIWEIYTGETSGTIRYSFPYAHISCLACGIIDDRVTSSKKKG